MLPTSQHCAKNNSTTHSASPISMPTAISTGSPLPTPTIDNSLPNTPRNRMITGSPQARGRSGVSCMFPHRPAVPLYADTYIQRLLAFIRLPRCPAYPPWYQLFLFHFRQEQPRRTVRVVGARALPCQSFCRCHTHQPNHQPQPQLALYRHTGSPQARGRSGVSHHVVSPYPIPTTNPLKRCLNDE